MTGYDLTRQWYRFKFDNPDKCRHIHSDLYFFIVYLWNELGHAKKFGLPTASTMAALGIGSYNTYKKALAELVEFGFVEIKQDAKNQFQSKIIALSKIDKATDEALDKAVDNARDKATDEALDKATDTINKLQTTNYKLQTTNSIGDSDEMNKWPSFDDFWNTYDKKVGPKDKIEKKWRNLKQADKEKIMQHLKEYIKATPDKKFRKNPQTYLNQQSWEDEIITQTENGWNKSPEKKMDFPDYLQEAEETKKMIMDIIENDDY